jgi:hypothetical protein
MPLLRLMRAETHLSEQRQNVRFVQVRFDGRGNLVVVPVTLAAQWEDEILKHSTRQQRVIVMDDRADRDRYMSSVSAMRECAAAA